jgi:hypothetical protein
MIVCHYFTETSFVITFTYLDQLVHVESWLLLVFASDTLGIFTSKLLYGKMYVADWILLQIECDKRWIQTCMYLDVHWHLPLYLTQMEWALAWFWVISWLVHTHNPAYVFQEHLRGGCTTHWSPNRTTYTQQHWQPCLHLMGYLGTLAPAHKYSHCHTCIQQCMLKASQCRRCM